MDGSGGMIRAIAASHLSFKYQELRTATGEFSQTNKLGQGGYGSVYKVREASTQIRNATTELIAFTTVRCLVVVVAGCAGGRAGGGGEAALLQHAAVGGAVLQRGEAGEPGEAQEPGQAAGLQRGRPREPPRLRVPLQHQPRPLPLQYIYYLYCNTQLVTL
jgi:hypothetical protein